MKLVERARSRVTEIDPAEVLAKLQRREMFYLVDVREEHEWVKARIPKARHLGKGVIERDIEKLIRDPNAEIVLYCGGGVRSVLAADNIRRMGYINVVSMAGGIRAWHKQGLPLEPGVLTAMDTQHGG
jgi:rhodanese-related sulfurtransferase